MPRVETGLPQINADTPRLLAHCFLFELDKNLVGQKLDYARYMDDINIGVDSVAKAQSVLRNVDLILQTRQLRLNTGKTLILSREKARQHYRVDDNMRLDKIKGLADRAEGEQKNIVRKFVHRNIFRGVRDSSFIEGNGDKILKRYLTIAARLGVKLDYETSLNIVTRYPSVRQNWYWYINATELDPDHVSTFNSFLRSGLIVDQAPVLLFADALVNCRFYPKTIFPYQLFDLLEELNKPEYYYQYSKLWLLWRFGSESQLFESLSNLATSFHDDHFFGRLAGGMFPRFHGSDYDREFRKLPIIRHIQSAHAVVSFVERISSFRGLPPSLRPILFSENRRNKNRITTQKFNLMLSIAKTRVLADVDQLIGKHGFALTDIYYREAWLEAGLPLVHV
jgi:hypothetical protein